MDRLGRTINLGAGKTWPDSVFYLQNPKNRVFQTESMKVGFDLSEGTRVIYRKIFCMSEDCPTVNSYKIVTIFWTQILIGPNPGW